jgi:hypothetical protein
MLDYFLLPDDYLAHLAPDRRLHFLKTTNVFFELGWLGC